MTTEVLAAGGVLWRPGSAGPEVAVVSRPRYGDWSLPKGKLDEDEPHLVAALREIREETGYDGRAGISLGSTSYAVQVHGHVVPKTVRWWSVRAGDGAFTAGDEVDDLRWIPAAEALSLLPDSQPLRRWASLPLDLAVVLLVRHGSAGDPATWDRPDDLRPLDAKGIAQSQRLVRVLRCYRPVRVVSAPPVRCRETVSPLATVLDLPVEIDPLVGEDAAPDRPADHVRDLAVPGEAVVVCSQGGVIPRVVQTLDRSRTVVAARKGSVWVLALGGGRLLSADDDVLR